MNVEQESHISPLGEAEFNALRSEILSRAQFQQQLINLSIIIVGALLTIFFQFAGPSWILLVYPLLSTIIAFEWSFNNSRIFQIGGYIRDEIENKWAGPGWENFLSSLSSRNPIAWLSGAAFAYSAFIILPMIVVFFALFERFGWTVSEKILLVIDILCFILIACTVRQSELCTRSR